MEEKEEGKIRINKYLSAAGVCSRREADRQIVAGNVRIGDAVAQIGDLVMPDMPIYYQGRLVEAEEEPILLVVNKPKGIVCTAQKKEKDNIVDFLHYPKRIYPIGRLDKQSEGLILMRSLKAPNLSSMLSIKSSMRILFSSFRISRSSLATAIITSSLF